MKHGKLLWCEDTPRLSGSEDVVQEYRRLFDADYNSEPQLEFEDAGDCFLVRTRHAVVAHNCGSYEMWSLT